MKKVIALTLAGIMGLSLLAGCNSSSGGSSSSASDASSSVADSSSDSTDSSASPDSSASSAATIEKVDVTRSDSESGIFVEAVTGMSDDFVLGCDISTLIAEENSGVKYYNEDGEEQDLLLTLAENGVNTVRVRVWNDPYDSDGNGYGGGNCDTANAIAIGERATKYGIKLMVDYHYSDFWCDPSKQMCPKAWEDMEIEEKTQAIYDYTYDSLGQILKAGIDVSIVQIGNETTTGMSGERNWDKIGMLMKSAISAIEALETEYSVDIMTAVHFTNPESGNYAKFAKSLNARSVNYDIFASSYYPYYHGTLENLTAVLKDVADTYGKKVMVAEVSYTYTSEDGDGFANSASADSSGYSYPYAISPQGQANCIRDVAQAVCDVGEAGMGVVYWEPAWIPVPSDDDGTREQKWEKYGSGWATSYAADYDPDDAGAWYGGSSWDNQALFDFEGHPLISLAVFRFLRSGATTDVALDEVQNCSAIKLVGDPLELPKTVTGLFNDGSTTDIPVVWKTESDESAYDSIGKYTISGTATYEGTDYTVTCALKVNDLNYLENDSFEDEDLSMWTITNIDNVTSELFVIDKQSDAVTGTKSLHFYSTNKDGVNFSVEQTVTNLKEGEYKFTLTMHGGDASEQEIEIYAIADGVEYTAPVTITDWCEYKYPMIEHIVCTSGEITVGARVKTPQYSWGNLDDFILAPQ